MDGFKKFSSGAGAFFERAVQKTEETFKTAEKTNLDTGLEQLIRESELRQKWAQNLITLTENVVQPNPAMKFEDMVLKGLDRKKERPTAGEQLGECMNQIASDMGTSQHAALLMKCGQAQSTIGQDEKVLLATIDECYIERLRGFMNQSVKTMQKDRDDLENARLDLDRVKTKIRRARDDLSKKQKSPPEDIPPQLEQERVEAMTKFNRHCDAARESLQQCITDFDSLQDGTTKFLEAQRTFYQHAMSAVQDAMRP